MPTLDLHEEFVKALDAKIPQRSYLTAIISEMLRIEKDAVYRRLSGKVNFSVHEMGIISGKLGISIDHLIHKDKDAGNIWLPFILEHPLKVHSMDIIFDIIDLRLSKTNTTLEENSEAGNICCSLPMEFYLYSPVLTKFMFFKEGYFFMGSEEYNNFADWELPERANGLLNRLKSGYNFKRNYYIWDESLMWELCKEIMNFHKMRILTQEEVKEIKDSLKDMLVKFEHTITGTYVPTVGLAEESAFYVSPKPLGFSSNYFISGDKHFATLKNPFNISVIVDDYYKLEELKRWIDSFIGISTKLSQSGHIERRVFFKTQHEITDLLLSSEKSL